MAFGVCTNCLSHPLQVKNGKFCSFFCYVVTTYNDEICHVKHVLDPLYVFFTLFGCWGGGALKGYRAQPANAVLQPR